MEMERRGEEMESCLYTERKVWREGGTGRKERGEPPWGC